MMSLGGAGSPSGAGPGTPHRANQPLAPSVVISPSAPVSRISSVSGQKTARISLHDILVCEIYGVCTRTIDHIR